MKIILVFFFCKILNAKFDVEDNIHVMKNQEDIDEGKKKFENFMVLYYNWNRNSEKAV